jgi:dipeptidyl aminopeptidase/acylaminoacyl peptidase
MYRRNSHERGFVGFAADYRRFHFGEDEMQDVLAAYRELKRLPFVDKRRIAVIGVSHGGYLAQMLASRIEPAAVVSFAGLSDIEGMFYETGLELRQGVSSDCKMVPYWCRGGTSRLTPRSP